MADELKDPKEQEQEMHEQLTEHAVKLVDKAYLDIAEQLKPEMEAWLAKLGEVQPDMKNYGSADLTTNVEGAVLIAMLAVASALLRSMEPSRALMYAVTARALSHRLVLGGQRVETPDVPDTFPQRGTGKA